MEFVVSCKLTPSWECLFPTYPPPRTNGPELTLWDLWQVLGTFITEWEAGAALCSRVLASDDVAQQVAGQLSHVAAFYGFDGWLVSDGHE